MLTRPTASSMVITDRLDPEESIKGGAQYLNIFFLAYPDTIPDDEKNLVCTCRL